MKKSVPSIREFRQPWQPWKWQHNKTIIGFNSKTTALPIAWNSSDCFESFSPLNKGVIMTRSNRMKFRLLCTCIMLFSTFLWHPLTDKEVKPNALTYGGCNIQQIYKIKLIFLTMFSLPLSSHTLPTVQQLGGSTIAISSGCVNQRN